MPKDLRTHIARLENRFPDEICTVERGPLAPDKGELCALLFQLERQGTWPCVRFKHVTDLRG